MNIRINNNLLSIRLYLLYSVIKFCCYPLLVVDFPNDFVFADIVFCNKTKVSNSVLACFNGNWLVVCFWLGSLFISSSGKAFIQVER